MSATAGPPVPDPDRDGLRLPEELVTGEAVALELRPASFAGRSLALLLDGSIMFGVLLGSLMLTLALSNWLDDAGVAALLLVIVVGCLVGLPVTVETLTRGRSAGKLAAGLRVVRDDGGPIRFRQALTRGLVAVLEVYTFPFVALLASLASRRGKRLGDHLAGTHVVRERSGVMVPRPVPMPPQLAGWAAGADIGRLPERLVQAARGFLGRAAGLHPQARQRLGVSLAEQVAARVAPTPPAGTGPEEFLAAVLAERTRRELIRLTRAEQERAARQARRAAASVLSPSGHRMLGDRP